MKMKNNFNQKLKLYLRIFQERYLFITAILAGALILVLIGFFLFLQPTLADKKQLDNSIESQKQVYSYKQTELNQLESVKQAYTQAQTEVEKATKVLPSDKEIPELVAQLEEITRKSVALSQEPLLFKSFSVGAAISKSEEAQQEAEKSEEGETEKSKAEETAQAVSYEAIEEGGYKSLPISVNLVGSFKALEFYLENVEKNLRLIDVTSINISSGQSYANLNFTINLKVYFQPKTEAASSDFNF
jgi:Tfp pilus assembly protein PilO